MSKLYLGGFFFCGSHFVPGTHFQFWNQSALRAKPLIRVITPMGESAFFLRSQLPQQQLHSDIGRYGVSSQYVAGMSRA